MVKIGFIVEGGAEKIILESKSFRDFLNELNIKAVGIFDAEGEGNFKVESKKIFRFVQILNDRKANYIVLWTDKEDDPCVSHTLNSVYHFDNKKQVVLVSVKALESWFLADSDALSKTLKAKIQHPDPENLTGSAFDEVKNTFIKHTGRGISKSKNRLAHKMVRNGFSIQNAAKHPECESAKYFINKLKTLSKEKE
ncbi:MAG: hypothetical protein U5Q03_02580 [Bacteroidota bacterium]|nr:hypothetical protein [Bacteroidota bacterium]